MINHQILKYNKIWDEYQLIRIINCNYSYIDFVIKYKNYNPIVKILFNEYFIEFNKYTDIGKIK